MHQCACASWRERVMDSKGSCARARARVRECVRVCGGGGDGGDSGSDESSN